MPLPFAYSSSSHFPPFSPNPLAPRKPHTHLSSSSLKVLSSHRGKAPHIMEQALLLLSSPPLVVLYLCSLYHALFISPNSDPLLALEGGATMASEGLVLAYTSWHFVGSWLFPVGCLAVWPAWLMTWVLGCQVVSHVKTSVSGSGDTASPHPHSD